MIQTAQLHRNPQLWKNSGSFQLDRFSPQFVSDLPSYAYMPFGCGEMSDIVWKISNVVVETTLARILQHFTVATDQKAEFGSQKGLLIPQNKLCLSLKQRDK